MANLKDTIILGNLTVTGQVNLPIYHHIVKLSGTLGGYYSFTIFLDIYNTTSTQFNIETISTYLYNRYGNEYIPCACRIYSTQNSVTYYEQFYGFYVGSGNYHYITWRLSTGTTSVTNNSNTTAVIRVDKFTGTGIPQNIIQLSSDTVNAI